VLSLTLSQSLSAFASHNIQCHSNSSVSFIVMVCLVKSPSLFSLTPTLNLNPLLTSTHSHFLDHTGTGYLRQTLFEALNSEFAKINNGDSASVASMHDSFFPFTQQYKPGQQGYVQLFNQRKVPEDEGQHLQNVYPSFRYRAKEFTKTKGGMANVGKLAYLADECTLVSDASHISDVNERIGRHLMDEWSHFWNTSTTFLLQKTPSLDVLFLESVKVLPTLHVIVLRHPMTSNSWNIPSFAMAWLDACVHVLELLAKGKVEWYAVVTYEALIQHHDIVVEELMEVVHRGQQRAQSTNNRRLGKNIKQSTALRHRRLRLHSLDTNSSEADSSPHIPASYLIPKVKSIELWEMCMTVPRCKWLLNKLALDVFPHLGYVPLKEMPGNVSENLVPDVADDEEEGGEVIVDADSDNGEDTTNAKRIRQHATSYLTSSPGPITVSSNFGHVLFSSEGNALKSLRDSRNISSLPSESGTIGHHPPIELVSTMKKILKMQRQLMPPTTTLGLADEAPLRWPSILED
jgi:hypothetical protein